MWYFGVLAGLFIGAMAQSLPAAIIFALLGGIIVNFVTRQREAQDTPAPKPHAQAPELIDLQRKIMVLEQRLQIVEAQLAEGFSQPIADAVQTETRDTEENTFATETNRAAAEAKDALTISLPTPAIEPPWLSSPFRSEFSTPEMEPLTAKPDGAFTAPPTQPAAQQTAAATPAQLPEPAIPFKDRLPEPVRNLLYGVNTLVQIGVLILFLGLAFLLRFAAEHISFPIELRYAGVAVAGAALLGLGWFLRQRRRDYALILQGMGVGVFYLTALSAMKLHNLIPNETGFVFLFAVSLLGAALAILQKAPVLAIIAALEGFATPLLVATGGNQMLALFTYLTILNLGIALIAWFNAWRILNLIGFVGTFTLASLWADQYYSNDQYAPVQAFLILFFLLFTAIGVFFARRTLLDAKTAAPSDENLGQQATSTLAQVGRVDSALVFGTPLTAFGLQYLLSKPFEYGPAFSALALSAFYLVLARLIFSRERHGLALLAEAYAIVDVIFGTLAIPLGFEGVWTGAAWAVEGAGMYWLGVRQNRQYARAFAYLVMIGASDKLLQSIDFTPLTSGPLLSGSTIGPVLLAISTLLVWWQGHRAQVDEESGQDPHWEAIPNQLTLIIGIAAMTVLPWQWFAPPMAAAATAVLSVILYFVARRFDFSAFFRLVGALQALSVVSFIATLHRNTSLEATAALESGVQGTLATLIIAASILLTAGWSMAQTRRTALDNGLPPDWSKASSIAVAVGIGLLHLAMLFGLSLTQAAIVWPITACAVLWAALRLSHNPLAAVAVALQLVSVGFYWFAHDPQAPRLPPAFEHLAFWTPLVFALAAWRCGDWIRAEAERFASTFVDESEESAALAAPPIGWFNPWCSQGRALWLPVLWGLGWWLMAWLNESSRVLEMHGQPHYVAAAAIAIVVATSLLISMLARWRDWPQLGAAGLFTLPALALCAYVAIVESPGGTSSFLPSAHLGAYLWPLALIWHLRALRWQERWVSPELLGRFHIVGFWFFLLLASREGLMRFAELGDPYASWAMLGWVLVPTFAFWLLRSPLLAERWPLSDFRHAYLDVACVPVAAYLLAWCVISNIISAGNASPLPYLPLLNPLELGQWLVLAALLLWWQALPDSAGAKLVEKTVQTLGAALGWFLLTATVLRTCHHWAGVPWDFSALFASQLTQAALSIIWSIMGVTAMLLGNRRASRGVWLAGAALLAVVVVKLFTVELADHGSLYRIVSFIGVGILLLIVGYFAPVPAKAPALTDDDPETSPKEQA